MFSKGVVDDYKRAVREKDWPSQSGILFALLRGIVRSKGTAHGEICEKTADKIIVFKDEQ